ncbi:hypothetical protein PINS_up020749 [Pythium insidiosum]|nr:hypothetical protein PINS_up020749 [Pythium insidiosum]
MQHLPDRQPSTMSSGSRFRESTDSAHMTDIRTPELQDPHYEHRYVLQDDEMVAHEVAYQFQSTRKKVFLGISFFLLAMASLYFFMVAIKLVSEGITLAAGCGTKGAFNFANNPIAGLMIGTMSTALIHSSSTITSITVALVGTNSLTIRQAVPIVMGANIGTCVTCIMVAFAQVGDRRRFERAMAAATVHDMYNIWSVIVMFPIEVFFHPLEKLSKAMSHAQTDGGAFKSPVDAVVNPLADLVIKVDKDAIYAVASGEKSCIKGTSFLVGGVFHGAGMSDATTGALVATIGFLIVIGSLIMLIRMMSRVFLGPTKRIVARALDYNGYLNILIGTALTFVVQSSTLVTSTLTPMAGLGVITLEQVYPLAMGANLGTTATALLASLVTASHNSVAIALVHFWFNTFGILLFYPIPITRRPVLGWATALSRWSAAWPMAAVIFVGLCFVGVPGVALGLVYMCTASHSAIRIVGWVLASLTGLALLSALFWYVERGGREWWSSFLERKRLEHEAQQQPPSAAEPKSTILDIVA